MVNTQVNGKIKYISEKTNGIVLEDEPKKWYNPIDGYKLDKSMVGKNVVLTMESGRVVFAEEAKATPKITATKNDALIVRQVALKAAVELACSMESPSLDFIKKTAAELEAWVLR